MKNESPLVSVLVTTYNRAHFIRHTIEAILVQTFEDFELLIVDDASTDVTEQVVQPYLEDPRVCYHRNERNLGQFANRNHAARLAQGKYIKYVDSDDLIYPHCLETMVTYMERYPDAGAALSRQYSEHYVCPQLFSPKEIYRAEFTGRGILQTAPGSWIARRDAFQKVNGFREEYLTGDYEFLLRLSQLFPLLLIPHGLTWYRAHPSQDLAIIKLNDLNVVEAVEYIPAIMRAETCPLSEEDCESVIRHVTLRLWRTVVRRLTQGRVAHATRMVEKAGLTWASCLSALRRPSHHPLPSRDGTTPPIPHWDAYPNARPLSKKVVRALKECGMDC
jgi:hypothetical protein